MIKKLFSFTLHLLILLAALAGALALFLHWTGFYDEDAYVAYLYDATPFQMTEIDQMAQGFAEQEVPFQSAPIYGDVTDRVADQIAKGANTIILNLAQAPSDELIATATQAEVTLLFVGALPDETQCAHYDKLWCYTSSPAYAGELLGGQVAQDYRDGIIADQNEDLLLDYVFINQNDTYIPTNEAVEATILELDHYGVYTTDVYDAAYRAALAIAQAQVDAEATLALENENTTTDNANEEIDSDITADDIEQDATKESLDESSNSTDLVVNVPFSDLTTVEVAFSIGSANANYLADQARFAGWYHEYRTVAFACIVENYAAAQALNDTGLYHSIVYFDTAFATETVVTMASNAYALEPVTNGTAYAQNAEHTFVLPHVLY